MATGDICHIEFPSTDMEKTKISDEFGSYAVFLDNVGNRFGLWSP